jgi:hypothetical protein
VESEETFDDHPILRLIGPDETVRARARAGGAEIVVTDRRLAVGSPDRLMLDIGLDGLRRIQFDIERDRPATLVVVPEHASHEPQVLAVPPDHYSEVATALAYIGKQLARSSG